MKNGWPHISHFNSSFENVEEPWIFSLPVYVCTLAIIQFYEKHLYLAHALPNGVKFVRMLCYGAHIIRIHYVALDLAFFGSNGIESTNSGA